MSSTSAWAASVYSTARSPPATVYKPVSSTVATAPTQNAASGLPKVSGSKVLKMIAPAYTVTETLVST